ncbi:MAG TPA: VOC family protein [Gemmatimonadaceae bacterium]
MTERIDLSPDASGAERQRLIPDALRLGPVRLRVSDLRRSLDYYTQVLGLEARDVTATTAALHAQGEDAPLVVLDAHADTSPVRMQSRLGLYHFAILLPDRAALGRFLAHVTTSGVHVGASNHLVSEALYLRDPDGLGIEIYADRPRSEWRYARGQLEMASDPLDMAGVVAAAQGEKWSGMPRGTVMGHVHLHVGDLDEAARFYHDALGFDRVVWTYPGALFLSAGGYHHHLGVNTWAGPNAPPSGERDARLLEWRMVFPSADDARAAAQRLGAAGHDVSPSGDDWIVADPWGTQLCLATS